MPRERMTPTTRTSKRSGPSPKRGAPSAPILKASVQCHPKRWAPKPEARIRCAFTKYEEDNERGGSRSGMKPMIGLDIMEVCQDGGGGGEGTGGASTTRTNCEFECNPDIVLHTGSPAAWLHTFKRERFAACLTEGVDRESESPWLRPRCERPIEWQYTRAAQGAEPAFVRWSRMGGAGGSTAEAVVRGLERRRAHYPAEPALETAQSVLRGWIATLRRIPIGGSGRERTTPGNDRRRRAKTSPQSRAAE